MMLKAKLTNDDFGKLDETTQGFYKQVGDDYELQVSGMTPKAKVDEFRDNNVNLKNQIDELNKKLSSVDMDKYNAMLEQEQKLKDKQLIDAGDIDKLIAQKTEVIQADYEGKIKTLTSQVETLTAQKDGIVHKYEIQGAASKAFAEHKIRPEAQEAIMSQINSKFTVKDNTVIALDGDKIVSGANGNLTVSEFVGNQPDFMKIPSQGGAGSGGGGASQPQAKSTLDKYKSGLAKLAK